MGFILHAQLSPKWTRLINFPRLVYMNRNFQGRPLAEPLTKSTDFRTAIERAMALVTDAINELDDAGAPADIAAHLETAVHRMTNVLNP